MFYEMNFKSIKETRNIIRVIIRPQTKGIYVLHVDPLDLVEMILGDLHSIPGYSLDPFR